MEKSDMSKISLHMGRICPELPSIEKICTSIFERVSRVLRLTTLGVQSTYIRSYSP